MKRNVPWAVEKSYLHIAIRGHDFLQAVRNHGLARVADALGANLLEPLEERVVRRVGDARHLVPARVRAVLELAQHGASTYDGRARYMGVGRDGFMFE